MVFGQELDGAHRSFDAGESRADEVGRRFHRVLDEASRRARERGVDGGDSGPPVPAKLHDALSIAVAGGRRTEKRRTNGLHRFAVDPHLEELR